ncbi:MAG TPA: LytTR family DNA-binding domain-containing protein [Gemmatimonadaceae bacterium]|nr:LytTR family DNA-binding domain-containing protein [Gemmatimonadaceae bacterium]
MSEVLPAPAAGPDPILEVLIVDDEPTARHRIARLLREIPGVTVVGECGSGRDALHAVRSRAPDLVFLDIAMPGLDGLAVAKQLAAPGGPLVVFVTAYDEHALEAYRIHAADYVLKPLGRSRLRDAVEHARLTVRRARAEHAACRGDGGGEGAAAAAPGPRRLALRDGHRTHVVPIPDVLWVESFGNYARVYTTLARYIHRTTMTRLAERLARHGFVRIHRSAIVNTAHIVRVQPRGSGQYEALLDTGLRLRVSRTYRDVLDATWRGGIVAPSG